MFPYSRVLLNRDDILPYILIDAVLYDASVGGLNLYDRQPDVSALRSNDVRNMTHHAYPLLRHEEISQRTEIRLSPMQYIDHIVSIANTSTQCLQE